MESHRLSTSARLLEKLRSSSMSMKSSPISCLEENTLHESNISMTSPSVSDDKNCLSPPSCGSSNTEPIKPVWLGSQPTRRKSPGTPCTRFSIASSLFPSLEEPSGVSTVDVDAVEPPGVPESTNRFKNRKSILSWNLFRSKSVAGRGSRGGESSIATSTGGNLLKKRIRPDMRHARRSMSNNDRRRLVISDLLPPQPTIFLPQRLRDSFSLPRPYETNREPRRAILPPPSTSKPPEATASPALAALDPHKRDSTFARIDAQCWRNIQPKNVIDSSISCFSPLSPSDDDKSVYSQDNGEEEAKRRLTSQLTAAISETGFLAGEATPFDPLNDANAEEPYIEDRLEHRASTPMRRRWPFRGSTTSESTLGPVRKWLADVRPPSEIYSPSTLVCDDEADVRKRSSSPSVLGFSEIADSEDATTRKCDQGGGEGGAGGQTAACCSDACTHHPLYLHALQSRASGAPSPPIAAANEKSPTPCQHPKFPTRSSLTVPSPPPPPPPSKSPSLASTPTRLTNTTSTPRPPTLTKSTHRSSNKHSNRHSNNHSNKNKPLPLLPGENPAGYHPPLASPPGSQSLANDLYDEIDEILDLYDNSKRNPDRNQEERDRPNEWSGDRYVPRSQPKTHTDEGRNLLPRIPNPVPIPVPPQRPPPSRPPRPASLDLSLLLTPPFPRPTPLDASPSTQYINYDPKLYAELMHAKTAEERAERRSRPARAVRVQVDPKGAEWI
jgi:hypothetical protein